jgi:very-short-patch-repair endonuclease
MKKRFRSNPKKLAKLMRRAERKGFNVMRHLMIRKMQLTINATRHEDRVRKWLMKLGIFYQFQKGFLAGGVMYVADFYLPAPYRIIIEVDGAHHGEPIQSARDRERDAYFQWRGFRVLRIWNGEVDTMSAKDLRQRIDTLVLS